MIVPMAKVNVAVRARDRDRLLTSLRDMGVVHIEPVEPERAVAADETAAAIGGLERALQLTADLAPSGAPPELSATESADEAVAVERRSVELKTQLASLHRRIGQLAIWGDLRLSELSELREAGWEARFYRVPREDAGQVGGELVHTIAELPGKRVLLGVVGRGGEPELPESAEPVPLPDTDRPTVREKAAEVDAELKRGSERLAQLAHHRAAMAAELQRLRERARYTAASRSGLDDEHVYAIQGWAPADAAPSLVDDLAGAGIDAAVEATEPDGGEQPPTLIRYPRWALPIKGLFDMLGTLPGYREIDVGGFFMVALPIFAAMLIGDAGYGLLFVLVPALIYRKATAAAGKPGVHLLMVMGAATIIWGVLTGVYFGVTPVKLIGAGGVLAGVGQALSAVQVIRGNAEEQAYAIMKVSFVMAAIHLSMAQLRQALALAPRLSALSKVGWAVFLWGIFLVIWYLFFSSQQGQPAHPLTAWLLAAGAGAAILFASPSRNPLKMVGLGIAQFPLSALSAFSDSISYIRLMGVGLASTIIGQTFNSLGANVADAATWFAGAFVVLFGHGLNIAMCMIAVLAHGVRLNMLEFSNNAGVQWGGYAYQPFAAGNGKEP